MGVLFGEGDLEGAVLGGDGSGVIPLEVTGLPVVEVGSFPVWIVTGVETSTLLVELVGKDELEFCAVVERGLGHCRFWGVWVDESSEAWKFGDLGR